MAHILSDHKHFVCEHYSEEHYHEINIDCELCEFQQASFLQVALYSGELNLPQQVGAPAVNSYSFVPAPPSLPYSLRGPPQG